MKRVLLVSMTALSLLVLGACGKKPEPPAVVQAVPTPTKEELAQSEKEAEQQALKEQKNVDENAKRFSQAFGAFVANSGSYTDTDNNGFVTQFVSVRLPDSNKVVQFLAECSLTRYKGCQEGKHKAFNDNVRKVNGIN